MSLDDGAPWFTVELEGVVLHVPIGEGKVFTLPMTPDGLHALIGEAVEKASLLKLPDVQKKIANKVVDMAVDWLARRAGRKA
jgi:hypothetical protein